MANLTYINDIFALATIDEISKHAPTTILMLHEDKLNFHYVSSNPNVSYTFFKKHQSKFNLLRFSSVCNMRILKEIFHIDYARQISKNKNLTVSFIKEHQKVLNLHEIFHVCSPEVLDAFHIVVHNSNNFDYELYEKQMKADNDLIYDRIKSRPMDEDVNLSLWMLLSTTLSLDKLIESKEKIQNSVLYNPNVNDFLSETKRYELFSFTDQEDLRNEFLSYLSNYQDKLEIEFGFEHRKRFYYPLNDILMCPFTKFETDDPRYKNRYNLGYDFIKLEQSYDDFF